MSWGAIASSHYVAGGGVAFRDDFNRADGGSLGENWNGSGFVLFNNAAESTGPSAAVVRSTTAAPTDDYYVEATVISGISSSSRGITARSPGAGLEQGYLWRYSNGTCTLFKTPGGNNYTQVGVSYNTTTTLPVTLRLEVQGDTIRGYANGTLLMTVTDTSYPTGRYGGMRRILGAGSAAFDDFEMGSL